MPKEKYELTDNDMKLLAEGLKRTYKERFEMATRLYKIQRTMNQARISHKPFINK